MGDDKAVPSSTLSRPLRYDNDGAFTRLGLS
jgi:hypothetical protein